MSMKTSATPVFGMIGALPVPVMSIPLDQMTPSNTSRNVPVILTVAFGAKMKNRAESEVPLILII